MANSDVQKLASDMKMHLSVQNGQRLFGPPIIENGSVSKPPHGTEIFVAKIPRVCSELDVYQIFRRAGPIYQIRMMMDFSGSNRGYCFVRYFKMEHARIAVKELNNFEIRKGKFIGVVESLDNCRLHIGGIPDNKSNEQVKDEIFRISEGATKVTIVAYNNDAIKKKRFCFVTYDTHREASIARKAFLSGKIKMWNRCCVVEWAAKPDDLSASING